MIYSLRFCDHNRQFAYVNSTYKTGLIFFEDFFRILKWNYLAEKFLSAVAVI